MFEITVKVPVWNIEAVCGYKPITTFWNDFSVADAFGTSAVADTFKRAFEEWKGNYKYLTELVMVLNHKIWQWFEKMLLWLPCTMILGISRPICS